MTYFLSVEYLDKVLKKDMCVQKKKERESEIDVSHFFLSKISQSRPKIDASQYEGNLFLCLVASVLGHFS